MSTEPRPSSARRGVSKKMLVAIVVMIAIILVPAAAFSLETCKLVIKATNMDAESEVECELSLHAPGFAISMVSLDPGEERVWTYSLRPGSYEFHMYYWFEQNYSGRSFSDTVSLFAFETEKVELELEKWS